MSLSQITRILNLLEEWSSASQSGGASTPIDGTLIYQVVNPLNTDDVMDTINAGIATLKNAGKRVINVQHSMTVDSATNYRIYNGVISYSNAAPLSNTTPMIKFTTVALQTDYTDTALSLGTIGIVFYGQGILAPDQYSVTGSTITINPGLDVEAGLQLVILFQTA